MGILAILLCLGLFVYIHWLDQQRRSDTDSLRRLLDDANKQIESLRQAIARMSSTVQRPLDQPSAQKETVHEPASIPVPYPVPAKPIAPLDTPPQQLHETPALLEPAFTPPPVERPAKKSIEQSLGTNWLNRLGITLLVFGVALFLAYQLTHIGALGKVIAGLVLSGALLGGGLWLERKLQYQVFARAFIGGGWALLFLTIYAAHYFEATRILDSEFVDLVLLFLVGAGMVLHSLRYRSQVVTGLAFLLAFSTVTLSQVTVYSLLASALLALGLEIVCVREGWFALEIAGIAAAYSNHFFWLDQTLSKAGGQGHPFAEFWPSTAVLLLFYLIFRIGYVLRTPQTEQAESHSGAAAVLNSAAILFVMRYQSFHPEWAFRALLCFGALELVFAFVVRSRKRPKAFAILATLASVLLLAAIPFRYRDATWPMLWLAEGEALFLAGFFLREKIFRWIGSLALLASVLILTLNHLSLFDGTSTTDDSMLIAITYVLAAVLLWINAEWLYPGLRLTPNDRELPLLQTGSFTAASCAAVALWIWFPFATTIFAWAALALLLLETGTRFRSVVLRTQAYGVLAITLLRLFLVNFTGNQNRIAAAIVVMAACAACSERLRRSTETSNIERRLISGFAATAATTVLSTLLYLELRQEWLIVGWAAMVVIQTAAALLRDGIRVRAQALLLAGMVVVRVLLVNFSLASWRGWPFWVATGLLFAVVPIAFLLRRKPIETSNLLLRKPEQLLFFLPLALIVAWLGIEIENAWLTLSWSVLGVLVFLLALAVSERSYRLAGVGLLLLGVAKLVFFDVWQLEETARYLSLIGVGIALLGVSFLYSRYADRLKEYL
ncbi:DUF2339 domain-containing protein [Terriglobus saanensis]|uniref:DUF2339 domain-containing protein n=1 Tax=Terriglobus saanensis (strain ATCC BAA-1853 / DSM 23119 / SP1PR4) TaxID=401053 RepID=E8UXE8_TERSS|nr:DUF2339 domain-containing protein [Terriglobus saanensis]ADV84172.1 Protein of unknown function DUF2339, transmembrane [Terriglobus saanensis SP1PR4]